MAADGAAQRRREEGASVGRVLLVGFARHLAQRPLVGGVAHDLSAKAFFRTVTFAPGSADKVRDGDIEVPKGETVDVAFATGKAGDYEMRCTHPLHAMFGMKGHVIVH